MIIRIIFVVVYLFTCVGTAPAVTLPVCSNRVINEVTGRIGCTIGDSKCWLNKGGFCTDYVNKMTKQKKTNSNWKPVSTSNIRRGDIAQFNSRAHYAFVERVITDGNRRPVAIDVSEYNYGDCWIDEDMLVTDKYMKINKRTAIPLIDVDGGFFRP
jgi:hypothetical protein